MTGKEFCYEMKKLRESLAKEYGIEGFEFEECDFKGDCQGFCPACDAEAMKLREEIRKKQNKKLIDIKMPNDVLSGKVLPPNYEGELERLPEREPLRGKIIEKPKNKKPLIGSVAIDFNKTEAIKDENPPRKRGLLKRKKKKDDK